MPNAERIDAVLSDVSKRPETWASTNVGIPSTYQTVAWTVARTTVTPERWDTLNRADWEAVVNNLCSAEVTNTTTIKGAIYMAESTVVALVVWDSAADLLDCTPDVLRTMIDLAEPPVCHQATLLLPYALVRFGEEIVQ